MFVRGLDVRLVDRAAGQQRLRGRHEALPLVLRRRREVRIRPLRAHRVDPGVEVGDVLVVDVEPVEGVLDPARGLHELRGRGHLLGVVEVGEAERRVDLVVVGGAQLREGVRLAVDRRPVGDDPERGPLGAVGLRPRRGHVAGGLGPSVDPLEHVDRQALPAEDVAHRVDRRLRPVRRRRA